MARDLLGSFGIMAKSKTTVRGNNSESDSWSRRVKEAEKHISKADREWIKNLVKSYSQANKR